MSLYDEQSANIRRTWFLITLFLVLTIGIGWIMSYVLNDQIILYAAVIISFVQTGIAYWFSDKIALTSVHAKEAEREKYFDLWNAVENLSITAGIPMPKVYIIEETAPNAFATGRNKENASVAVTTGLLEILDKTELEGVIAHELSHIKNRDILVSSVVLVLVGIWAILSDIILRSFLFGRGGSDKDGNNILAIIGVVFIILSPILGLIIQLATSRKREFLADASGALLTRYPEGLANALVKINEHSGRMKMASGATAHMFITNPFGNKKISQKLGFWSKIFMTHPPITERVAALVGKDN